MSKAVSIITAAIAFMVVPEFNASIPTAESQDRLMFARDKISAAELERAVGKQILSSEFEDEHEHAMKNRDPM